LPLKKRKRTQFTYAKPVGSTRKKKKKLWGKRKISVKKGTGVS